MGQRLRLGSYSPSCSGRVMLEHWKRGERGGGEREGIDFNVQVHCKRWEKGQKKREEREKGRRRGERC